MIVHIKRFNGETLGYMEYLQFGRKFSKIQFSTQVFVVS